jgi:hypothetical protein
LIKKPRNGRSGIKRIKVFILRSQKSEVRSQKSDSVF